MAHTRLDQLLKIQQITREAQKATIQALEYHKPIPPADRDDPEQEEPRDEIPGPTENT